MSETHDHDHRSSAAASNRVKHLVAVLERNGILTEAQLDATVEEFLLHARPANGKKIVARAWVDPDFKARLLADANAAIAESGVDLGSWPSVALRALENTPERHNVVVCTLCSCYPIALLGPSPTWYKSEAYRSQMVRDPRGVLEQFGYAPPEGVAIDVWDSTADLRYFVIPMRPDGTESLSEEELAALVTRNGLIGTAPL